MRRELKDELQNETPQVEPTSQKPQLQIQINEAQEKTIVQMVLDDYQKAKAYRDTKEYRTNSKGEVLHFDEHMKSLNDLYFGKREPKTKPWANCSNRSLRIAMAILEMLCSKFFPMIYNEDLNRWRPGEKTDFPKVKRITKFMDWWVRVYVPMQEFFDSWIMTTVGYGDSLVEILWDVEYKDIGEFDVTNIVDEQGNVLEQTQEKRLKLIEKTKCNIIPKENVFFQKGQKDIHREPIIIKDDYRYGDLEAMEMQGQVVNVQNFLRKTLESKTEVSGDPSLTEQDLSRLKEVKLRSQTVNVLIEYMHYDWDNDGFSEDIRVLIDQDNKLYLSGVEVKNISKRAMRPIEWTKFLPRLDDVDGLDGLGALEMMEELAREIDACFNQLTDSNTLALMRPGFYDPSGNLNAPTLYLSPSKITPVSDPQRNVYFPDFDIPTERLIIAIRLVLEFIERLTAASSYVMGKESEIVGGSGTATRTNAILMNAMERFQRPGVRLKAGAARILTQIFDKIQLNIPIGFESRVLGEDGEPIFKQNELTDEGLSGEFDAFLLEDSSGGSKNIEREISGFLYGQLLQNPLIGTDPMKIYKITFKLIESHTSHDEAERIMGPEPDEKDNDSPEDENTLMIQGEFTKVRALISENHIWHLQVHQSLNESPTLVTLPDGIREQVLQYNQNHMQEHQMMMQAMIQNMLRLQGGQGGTNQGTQGQGMAGAQPSSPFGGMGGGSPALNQSMLEKRSGEVKPTP